MAVGKLFELLPEPIGLIGPDFVVRRQNPASLEEFGAGRNRRCYEVQFGRSEPCHGCMLGEVLRGGRTESWFLEHHKSDDPGPSSYYEITLVPVANSHGDVVELIEIVRDATMTVALEHHLIRISEELDADVKKGVARNEALRHQSEVLRDQLRELQETQARMVQTEKLASLGRLAAGLTHEIHTPLGTILANLDVLKRRIESLRERGVEDAGEDFERIREVLDLHDLATDRIHKIVRSLRMFAHLDRAVEEFVDPHEGIDAALMLLTHELRDGITVERDYGDIPPVRCRPDAMNQVYMNLLQNAVQAIDGNGTIRIVSRVDGDRVVLEFHDDGVGIPEKNLDKLFEPGFTSKPRGIGTGLGLAIAYRTMEGHGGRLDVESEPGVGTVFTVRLPIEVSPPGP